MRGIGFVKRRPATTTFILGLLIWYAIQHTAAPAAGIEPGTDAWREIFAVSTAFDSPHSLLTSPLSHLNRTHLASNLVGLACASAYLETRKPPRSLLIAFAVFALLTALSYVAAAPIFNYRGWGMGASGVAYAFTGGLIVEMCFVVSQTTPTSLSSAITGGFVLGLSGIIVLKPFIQLFFVGAVAGGVATVPHLVGLVLGMLWIARELVMGEAQPVFHHLDSNKKMD